MTDLFWPGDHHADGLMSDRTFLDAMVAVGAIEEVRRAAAAGASPTARAALGFAELSSGDIDAMKRRTRRYARRQLTWMRKLPNVELIDMTGQPAEDVVNRILP